MTSPDIASSIDDPSPTIPELVDYALGLQLEGKYGYSAPEPAINTFQTMSGAIVLKRLLPHLTSDSILLLRDAITQQNETIETTSSAMAVSPVGLFSGWIARLRSKTAELPPVVIQNPLDRIEITNEITGLTKQVHLKTYPESHALIVRKTSLTGSFTLDDEPFEFNPDAVLLEVGKMSYDPGDYYGRIAPKGRRYTSLLPDTGDVYRSKRIGGSINDVAISDDEQRAKTLHAMTHTLNEVQSAGNVILW